MKIFIILLLSDICISFLGMLYWMYKSKEGELSLSSSSWHFKLLNWMWEAEIYNCNNACPYYWGIVLSIHILPIYLICKLIYIVYKWLDDKLPSFKGFNVKLPKVPLPEFNIPETKKQWWKLVYTKGKNILISCLTILFVGLGTIAIISLFIYPYLKFNLTFAIISSIIGIWAISSMIVHIVNKDLDKYHINHYTDVITGIVGLFKTITIPLVLLWKLVEFVFSKLFKQIYSVYKSNCPPISWNSSSNSLKTNNYAIQKRPRMA